MVIDQFVVERLHHASKAAAQQIYNVSTFEKSMMEAGLTKKIADFALHCFYRCCFARGKTSAFPGAPHATTARAVVHDGSQYGIGDVVFSGGECGEVAACCDEHGSLYVVVEVLRRMRQVTPHSALFTPTKAMKVWRVESLDAAGAWLHDAGSTLVVW